MNTSTPDWLVEKYKEGNDTINFHIVQREFGSLFSDLKNILNADPIDLGKANEVIIKIISLLTRTKKIINDTENSSLVGKINFLEENMLSFHADLINKQAKLQRNMFDKTLEDIVRATTFLGPTNLIYHSYDTELAKTLEYQIPHITISTEHPQDREKFTKQDWVRYFSIDGSSCFTIEGDINKETLGKHYYLTSQRHVAKQSMYNKVENDQIQEKIFHHYFGLCMFLDMIEKKYADKQVTINGKTITAQQYIDAIFDSNFMESFARHIEELPITPSDEDVNKILVWFNDSAEDKLMIAIRDIFKN